MWLLRRILLFIVLAGIASLIGWFGEFHWLADLANHFRWYYLLIALVGAVLFCFARKWMWVGVSLVVVGLNYPVLLLYTLSKTLITDRSEVVTFVQVNVNFNNSNTAPLVQWLQQRQPDIVAVEEFSPVWSKAFEKLHTIYPYRIELPRADGFGIALFSRHSINDLQLRSFGPDQAPSITGVLPWKQQKIQLLVTHPFPPVSQAKAISRDLQLADIASWLKVQQKPTVLLGDLNTTLWGHSFKKLIDEASLYSTRDGVGMLASWPSKIPLIPIDHILLSKSLKSVGIQIGPDIGSDHLPVILEVGL